VFERARPAESRSEPEPVAAPEPVAVQEPVAVRERIVVPEPVAVREPVVVAPVVVPAPVSVAPAAPSVIVAAPRPAPPPARPPLAGPAGADEPMLRIAFGRLAAQLPPDVFVLPPRRLSESLREPHTLVVPQRLVVPQLGEGVIEIPWTLLEDQFPELALA